MNEFINKLDKESKQDYLRTIKVYKPTMGEIENGLIVKNTLAVVTTIENEFIVVYEMKGGKEKEIGRFPMKKELA